MIKIAGLISPVHNLDYSMNTRKKKAESNVVCIVGMHRSGTSMVTQLLHLCGLYLGTEENLLGPDRGNPLGHFEHVGFKRLNEALLAHFGGSTDNPPELEPNWEDDSSLCSKVKEAELLLAAFEGKTVWGWKEPRTTLLIPFWRRLLPHVRFVICVRNPLEVARSIADRDGMPLEKGLYLWKRYMHAALRDTEGYPRSFTFYEDYFANGLNEIEQVANFCGLSLPPDLQRLVYSELRHYSYSTTDLINATCVPIGYKLLYLGLRFLASRGRVNVSGTSDADDVSKDIGAFWHSMTEFYRTERLAESDDLLLKRNYEVMELQSQVTERDKRIEALVEDNARLQRFADAVRRTVIYRIYRRFIRPLRGE